MNWVVFKKETFENVTVTGINVDGVDLNFDSASISGGDDRTIIVSDLSGCVGGSRTYSVKITYKDKYGIQHTVGPSEFVVNCTPDVPVVPAPPFEDGSYAHPFLLSDCNELQGMSNDLDANYALAQDINCFNTINWNLQEDEGSGVFGRHLDFSPPPESGFVPIGDAMNEFTGSLDGGNYSVSNLYIYRPNTNNVGLFGYVNGSEVKDLGMENSNITGNSEVGGIIGYQESGTVSGSYSTGSVTGSGNYVGGLVGYQYGVISGSYSAGSINSSGEGVGGLVGDQEGGAISDSYSTGSVTSSNDGIGGLVGWQYGSISNSHSTGAVNGVNEVGGLVGLQYPGVAISNSYSTGAVNGVNEVGGLVGTQEGTVSASYSTGSVNGSGYDVGGLAGHQYGTISDSYSTGSVNGTSDSLGGLVGFKNSGAISNSYSTGNVTGTPDSDEVGGLVGDQEGGAISDSYSIGNVTGGYDVGGLVGGQWDGSISNSYSTGITIGTNYVGGLVGWAGGAVSNSYSTGAVSGTIDVGGLVGFKEGTVSNCGWWTGAGDWNAIGNPDGNVTYNEADKTVFYSQDHNVYDTVVPYWTFGLDKNWTARVDNYPILTWQVE
ncbi:MAG: hypothetical protein NTZ73_03765 [Candidatus Diapherotrites archaeon]|nr:hypothetical protein [Candidatus Diapherotrites archaeon]